MKFLKFIKRMAPLYIDPWYAVSQRSEVVKRIHERTGDPIEMCAKIFDQILKFVIITRAIFLGSVCAAILLSLLYITYF